MDTETSFGRWLRQRRRVLDLTQQELAKRARCSVGTIRKIEADERRPSKAIASHLADCLGIAGAGHPTFIEFARTTPSSKRPSAPVVVQPPPAQILTTKLYLPRTRPTLVPRPRLLARLNNGLSGLLTLIAAPAGFGKTTLLSDWLTPVTGNMRQGTAAESSEHVSNRRSPGRSVAWLALDAEDNDLSTFLCYLVAALQTIAPAIGSVALALLRSPQTPAAEVVLTALLNDVADTHDEATFPPSILVLDDYHVITAPPVQQAVGFLVEHLPPQLHLVIATRLDPALSLARLRARGQLCELRADQLRFTVEEARTFLTKTMGLPLADADVAALEERTEGWVAGLQLAAIALQDRADRSDFVQTFSGSNRYVLDYLVEEVFRQQPPHIQIFLLQTSILDRLCGPLCDAVLGVAGRQSLARRAPTADVSSQLLLEHLERANLFLIPLDGERRWYRYHHLFTEALRERLASGEHSTSVAALHRRASAWYEQQGLIPEAVQHALAAKATDQAAHLVEQASLTMMQRSELQTLQRWIEALPVALVRTRPWLALRYAWLLRLNGDLTAAEAWLGDAEQATPAAANERVAPPREQSMASFSPRHFRGEVAALRATFTAAYGDRGRTVILAQEALDNLPAGLVLMRGAVTSSLGIVAFQTSDLPAAERAFSETRTLFESVDNQYGALLAIQGLGQLYTLQGRLRAVSALFQPIIHEAHAARGGAAPIVSLAYTGMAQLLYEWNDLPAAVRQLGTGIDLAERGGMLPVAVIGRLALARVRQAQGDSAGARVALIEAEQHVSHGGIRPTWLVPPTDVHRARLDLAQGDVLAAMHWAETAGLSAEEDPHPGKEFEYLTLARLLLAQGKPDAAQRLLTRLLAAAEADGRAGRAIEILSLQALALRACDEEQAALDALAHALIRAAPEGYVRLFVDEGAPMAALVAQSAALRLAQEPRRAQNDPVRAYAESLLLAFPSEQRRKTAVDSDAPSVLHSMLERSNALIEPLSEREIEVLRLIASGLSDRAIAEKLILAIGTVKKHLNNIYSKLGVHTRTQALARAHSLNVL
jgi:LuxR family transcriptional regulator, maltose regulon positive regulatory protein